MPKQLTELNDALSAPDEIIRSWLAQMRVVNVRRRDLVNDNELRVQMTNFIAALAEAVARTDELLLDDRDVWRDVRSQLREIAQQRTRLGFKPGENAMFIFALKPPLVSRLTSEAARANKDLAAAINAITVLLDSLGLYVTDMHLEERESIIDRQQQELLELSTPVIEIWDSILALPLVGTLDSQRAERMTEQLLTEIADRRAETAIIDITGVPAVDTATAQHLLQTIAAARLMGAEVIISGLRPSIAQTMVGLGLELPNVVSRASLAGALRYAFKNAGLRIRREEP